LNICDLPEPPKAMTCLLDFLDVEINDSSLVSFECHPVPNFNKCHVNNPYATLEFR
jgi:hypothetical protein